MPRQYIFSLLKDVNKLEFPRWLMNDSFYQTAHFFSKKIENTSNIQNKNEKKKVYAIAYLVKFFMT